MFAKDNPVEELLSRRIPQEVWHYTTLDGFAGILSSGRIWATDARFTNDSTEFVHAREIVTKFLKTKEQDGSRFLFPVEELSRMLDKAFDEGALSPLENDVYISSFSADGDLKGQWAEYGDNYRGVSIGFDFRSIRPPQEEEVGVTFAPCIYDPNEKLRLIESSLAPFEHKIAELDERSMSKSWMDEQLRTWRIIDRIFGQTFERDQFERKLQSEFEKEILESWGKVLFNLLRSAAHCKHPAFSAEQEWRLALARPRNRPHPSNPVLYRGANGKIPYIPFNFFRDDDRVPITRVIAGPLCERTDEIRAILQANGYSIPSPSSAIPFRDTARI